MIFIGIDPDVDKSGYAAWDSSKKQFLFIRDDRFFDLIKWLGGSIFLEPMTVIIEGGWLVKKSNFHSAKTKGINARIGKNVGQNHQVGKLIAEYCKIENINHDVVMPLKKKWGKDGKSKISHAEFKKITGYALKTNQEKRDAAMLVFNR